MRKIVFKYIIFLSFLFIFKSKCLGVSDSFKFIIDTIGIPQYNVLGDEINEEIYNAYNLFVYSNPLAMYSRTDTQRFKEVKDNDYKKIINGTAINNNYNVLDKVLFVNNNSDIAIYKEENGNLKCFKML